MPRTGIAIVIDDGFRRAETCRHCKKTIGPHSFAVLYYLDKPEDVWFEHIHCKKLMEEADAIPQANQ